MKKMILATVLAGSVFAGAVNAAGFDGGYVGVGIGSMKGELDGFNGNADNSANFNLNLGYGTVMSNFYLGGEISWRNNHGDFGTGTGTMSGIPYTYKATSSSGVSISIIPGVLITPNTMLFGRIGRSLVSVDEKFTSSVYSDSSSGDTTNHLHVGAGINYKINDSFSAVGEYFKIVAEDGSMGGLSAGVKYHF